METKWPDGLFQCSMKSICPQGKDSSSLIFTHLLGICFPFSTVTFQDAIWEQRSWELRRQILLQNPSSFGPALTWDLCVLHNNT